MGVLLMGALVVEARAVGAAQEGRQYMPARRPRVAVWGFRKVPAAPDQAHWGYVLSIAVAQGLSAVSRVIVVDLSQLVRVLGDKTWEPMGPTDPAKLQELVAFTHADLLVTGTLQRTQKAWTVETALHSGSPSLTPTTFTLSGTDLLEIAAQLVQRLLSALSVAPSAQEMAKIQSKPTPNLAAYEEVAKCMRALEEGRAHRAVSYCKKAREIDPHFVRAHGALGTIYLALGQGELAMAAFTEALRLDPTDLSRTNLAVAYRKTGRVEEALREYAEVIKHHPTHAYIRVQQAVAYGYNRDYHNALAAFKEALRLDPYVPDAHYLLGMLYQQHNRLEEAKTAFRQAINDYPADGQAYVMLAVVHQRTGDIDASLTTLKEGIQANPRYGKLHNNLAAIYAAQGLYDLAWRHVHEAQRLGFEVAPELLHKMRQRSKDPGE